MLGGSLLQWNIEELSLMCFNLNPHAIYLQWTHLRASESCSLKAYMAFNKQSSDVDWASGGSSILVRHDIVCISVALDTTLHTAAVHLTLHKTLHLCSLYLRLRCSCEPVTLPLFTCGWIQWPESTVGREHRHQVPQNPKPECARYFKSALQLRVRSDVLLSVYQTLVHSWIY